MTLEAPTVPQPGERVAAGAGGSHDQLPGDGPEGDDDDVHCQGGGQRDVAPGLQRYRA